MICLRLFFLFLILTTSSAFIFPDNKELIYNYYASVKVGSNEPAVFSSEFEMYADIHIKKMKNGTLFQLKDVTYSLHMGESFGKSSVKLEIPNEAKSIELPFVFHMETKESTGNISVDADDQVWSVNIKRSIATLFTINEKILREKKLNDYVWIKEDSCFGRCGVIYRSVPSPEGHKTFNKKVFSEDCLGFIWYLHSAILPNHDDCGSAYQLPLATYVERNYNLIQDEEFFYIDSVESDGSILISISNEENFALVSQKIELKSTKEQKEPTIETNEFVYKSLEYEKQYQTNGLYDTTGGRRKFDIAMIKMDVKKIFLSICKRINNVNVRITDVFTDERENVIILLEKMRHLDDTTLFELYKELLENEELSKEEQVEIYALALALTGTTQSLLAIEKLMDNVMDEKTIVNVLREIPFHVKLPKQLFLEKLMKYAKLDSTLSETVREAAILAVSAMIKSVPAIFETEIPEMVDYSEYVDYFKEQFESATDSKDKILYMSALINMQIENVTNYLTSIVKNENTALKLTPHMRTMAMFGVLQHMKNGGFSQYYVRFDVNLFIPLYINVKEDYEVRMTALYFILYYGSEYDYLRLFFNFNAEKDERFLRLIYTTFESFSKSTSNCYKRKLNEINHLMRYLKKPKISINFDYLVNIFDYYDRLYDIGSMFKTVIYGDEMAQFETMYLQYTWNMKSASYDQYSIYANFRRAPGYSGDIPMFPGLLKMTESEVQLEIIIFRNNLVWRIMSTSPKEIAAWVTSCLENGFDFPRSYHLDRSFDNELVVATDVGVPISIYLKKPSMIVTQAVTRSDGPGASLEFLLSGWNRGEYGLKIYNPLADLWHGVQRVQTTDYNLYAYITKMKNKNTVKVMNEKKTPLGFKLVVHTEVFTSGRNTTKKMTVESTRRLRKDMTIWSVDEENTGLVYNFKIFNCEAQDMLAHAYQIKQRFLISDRKNWADRLYTRMYFVAQHVWDYFSVFPGTGKCGVILSIEKSENYNITHYELERVEGKFVDDTEVNFVERGYYVTLKSMHMNEVVGDFKIETSEKIKSNEIFSKSFTLQNLKNNTIPGLSTNALTLNATKFSRNNEMQCNINVIAKNIVDEKTIEDTLINITMIGKLSKEQNENKDFEIEQYRKCSNNTINRMNECVEKLTYLRSYEIDISYQESASTIKNIWMHIKDLLRVSYPGKFEKIGISEEMNPGNLKLHLLYPLHPENIVDLTVISPNESFTIDNILLDDMIFKELLKPYSKFVSPEYAIESSSCEFTTDSIRNDKNSSISTKWTKMIGECSDEDQVCSWEVSAKRINESTNMIMLRVMVNNETVDFHIEENVKIHVNDELLDTEKDDKYYHTEWTDIMVLKDDSSVIVHLKNIHATTEFNGYYVKMNLPESELSKVSYLKKYLICIPIKNYVDRIWKLLIR